VSGETNEDTNNPITLTALFTDVDVGDTHTFQIDTNGTKGVVIDNGNGTFSYDPNGAFESLGVGETAQDSFVFKVTDNSGAFSTATATIIIHGENDAPSPAADMVSVRPGSIISLAAANGVLSNDHDPDANDKLSVTGVKFENTTVAVTAGGSAEVKGAYGTLTIHSDGSFAYAANKTVPSQGLAQDKFDYVVSDGHNGTAQATLTVTLAKDGYVLGAPGDILTGGTGKQILDGSLGQQQLLGGNGKDVLIGGPGDVLTGGNGPDTFAFGKGFGHVTITDFDTHIDVLQFSKGLFPDVASILNHVTSDGHGGATLSVDQDNSISLLGVNPMTLQKADFLIL
jgi:serralysin